MRNTPDVRQWFPSDDGNPDKRELMMRLIGQILTGADALKDPDSVYLKGTKRRSGSFYNDLLLESEIPGQGVPMEQVGDRLLELLHAHPYHTKYFLTNILPMASIPGILGMITAFIVNGNNLWDVYGPAGAEAEVKVIGMMSKLVGYDPLQSGGYTSWGGQGAIFTGLRIAISKFVPDAMANGVPDRLYAFCSEAAHYSLFKSMEATGLGSRNLVKVRTKADSSMDVADLCDKMESVIRKGGVPVYIVATTGTTDALGIDNVREIYEAAKAVSQAHGLKRPHIHADSALGGFFAFFNDYDFAANPLALQPETLKALQTIQGRMTHLGMADSLCFDFQKLGQTPYLTSLLLVKDAADLRLLDLDPDETPYVGHRGYGQYHTGYTLECSRMASSISMYSALLAFGVEGYQRLLAQFVDVNLAFRRELASQIPEAVIVNPDNPGLVTLFRIYPGGGRSFREELSGSCTLTEIRQTNALNEKLFETLGERRDRMFFGDTKKHLIVPTADGGHIALYAAKFFVISPYTQVEHVSGIVRYLKEIIAQVYESDEIQSDTGGTVGVGA
ncbi:aspartate aminotransferase family protein [Cohnella sp. CFH 77786]|uniref:pyridoxal phosphate-dependent decarboxylase family protein n=1 Tax=Cohnella sp. CFH 77786 TaxID=2662265 RepID=UPI001C60FB23|nr:pyridoxal-dependent decarboxylase [Cohnella sp. CFH 77786]MBW5448821.1 aspartate aminotransferase family protein [Cohnella sp. CFH 77786]